MSSSNKRSIPRIPSLRAKPYVNKLQDRLRRSIKMQRASPLVRKTLLDHTVGDLEDSEVCSSMDDQPQVVVADEEIWKAEVVETAGEQLISEWRMRNTSSMEGWEGILDSLAQGYNQGSAFKGTCGCKLERVIRLVKYDAITRISIPACNCGLWPGWLTARGYFPGSPKKPTVAFPISLLRICSDLVSWGPFTKQGFVACWVGYLEEVSYDDVKAVDKQWLAALNIFPRMKQIAKGGCTTLRKLESLCPACFYQNSGSVVVCLDGNFTHKRYAGKGKDAAEPSARNMSIFLPNISLPLKPIKKQRNYINIGCTSNFTADSESRKTWDAFHENGLMIATCRHDIPLRVVNIVKSGENYAYPAALIASIVAEPSCPTKVIVCYDVACKFAVSAKTLLPAAIFERLEFVIPSFHIQAHNFVCMLMYHAYYNMECGLTNGESCERVWSSLRHLVSSGRYSASSVRHEQLTLALLQLVDRKNSNLPKLLFSLKKNAGKLQKDCERKLLLVLDVVHEINGQQVLLNGDYLDLQFRSMQEFYSSPSWTKSSSIPQPLYLSVFETVELIHENGPSPRRLQDLEASVKRYGHRSEQWKRNTGEHWIETNKQKLMYDATQLKRAIWREFTRKEQEQFALKSRRKTGTRAVQDSKPRTQNMGKTLKEKLRKYNSIVEALKQVGNATLRSIDSLTNIGITSEIWDLDRCAPDMPWACDEKLVMWVETYQKLKAANRELELVSVEQNRAKAYYQTKLAAIYQEIEAIPLSHEPDRLRKSAEMRRYKKLNSQLQDRQSADLATTDSFESDEELILANAIDQQLAIYNNESEEEHAEESDAEQEDNCDD